jgi:hypothetical protein
MRDQASSHNRQILVPLYNQAQRIYSLTPATGAIPMYQASCEPWTMQTAQIADKRKEFDNG